MWSDERVDGMQECIDGPEGFYQRRLKNTKDIIKSDRGHAMALNWSIM